ncbi:MAG: hypothetical protein J6P14_05220 [Ruminococcus sp.]|nr:hypothetical protein [Ruminococcus sp.]
MKKTRKLLSIMTSMALFTCAASVPMESLAAVVSDNTIAELENGAETVKVRISYNYDASIPVKVKKEAAKKAGELTIEYANSLDTSKYTDIEIMNLKSEYYTSKYEELSKELDEKAKKELVKPVLEDIGADITENIVYPFYGVVYCELTAEQLEKAKNNSIISIIAVDSDFDEYGNYIGTPNPYIMTGTTSTVSSTTAITSTTVTTAVSTLPEEYGTEMFTDTIESIGRDMVKFKEHGAYYLGITQIEDVQKLMTYKQGSEVLIGIEYIRANDTHVSINKIFMLSRSKLDLGDPTGDSMIDARDASFVLAEYSLLSTGGASHLTTVEKTAADANKDGQIDSKDASLMLGMYAYNATSENKIETMNSYIEYLKTNE